MDIQNVFLHENLDEEVYMKIPQGYKINTSENKKKSIYGLKQASRAWFSKLRDVIKHLGITQCKSSYFMFTSKHNDSTTVILAYVDYLLITGNKIDMIIKTKEQLKHHLQLKI